MDGITQADLEARHAECTAARLQLQRDFELKDTGFAYVLGELEGLLDILKARELAPKEEKTS
jgi:hypothetical protein